MENRVPLPTDNVYKFYALFGLLLVIFALSAGIYTTKTTNDQMFVAIVELEELESIATPSPKELAKRAVIERQMELAKSDRQVFYWGGIALGVMGAIGMMFGFERWHSVIQPKQDELVELQLMKLRHEVAQLKGGARRVVRTRR
jgi:hypothetical protein